MLLLVPHHEVDMEFVIFIKMVIKNEIALHCPINLFAIFPLSLHSFAVLFFLLQAILKHDVQTEGFMFKVRRFLIGHHWNENYLFLYMHHLFVFTACFVSDQSNGSFISLYNYLLCLIHRSLYRIWVGLTGGNKNCTTFSCLNVKCKLIAYIIRFEVTAIRTDASIWATSMKMRCDIAVLKWIFTIFMNRIHVAFI